MSQTLVNSLATRNAGDVVYDLDVVALDGDEVYSVGPFGVFRACSRQEVPLRSTPDINPDHVNDFAVPDEATDFTGGEEWQQLHYMDGFDMNIVPDSTWFDPGGISGWLNLEPDANERHNTRQMPITGFSCPQPLLLSDDLPQATHYADVRATDHVLPPSRIMPTTSNITTPKQRSLDIPTPTRDISKTAHLPTSAAALLRYFRSEVLSESPQSLHSRVSPWKLLILPQALEAFAELSIWTETTHIRQSILSTVLSKSAFHLHQADSSNGDSSAHWLRVAREHNKSALNHLNASLRCEIVGQSQVPYTELLMAILALATVTVSC
jgi:arginine metabolism regulation protein II